MIRWVSDKSLSRYFKEIMRYRLLSREEESRLARRARLGDVIVAADGKRISSPLTLARLVKARPLGTKITLAVCRNDSEKNLVLSLLEEPHSGGDKGFTLGMKLEKVSQLKPEYRKVLGTSQGVIVEEVEPGSPAAEADIRDYHRESRDKLILHNLRWVVTIAKQYQNRGLTLSELINEGNLGLIQAVSKFDETRNTRLTTYSNWWIRYYIVTALASRHLIKLPIKMRNLAKRIRDSYGILTQRYGRTPSIEEIAKELEASPEEVSCAFDCGVAELSIDALPFEDSKISFEEVLKDTTSPSPSELSGREQVERDVRASVYETLAPRELYVISRHFGVPLPQKRFTLRTISGIFGRPQGEIKHLICAASRKIIAKLWHSLGNEGLKRYAKIPDADIRILPDLLKEENSKQSEKCLGRVMRRFIKHTPSTLTDLLAGLRLEEREALVLFWKLQPPQEELNLRELGDLLGVSREAARQVKERAIKKLRKQLRPQAFDNFFREGL